MNLHTQINIRKKVDGWFWYLTNISSVMNLHEAGPFKIEALARKDIYFFRKQDGTSCVIQRIL